MFFLCDTSSSDEETKQDLILQRKILRQRSDIWSLPDDKFENYFRLNKAAFKYVLGVIDPVMKKAASSTSVCNTIKLAATLRFLGQGSYPLSGGDDFQIGLSQPIVSNIVDETLSVLESRLCPIWIQLKMTEEKKLEAMLHFYTETGFPSVIGCVDGTHIEIVATNKDDPDIYYNHKGNLSLNAMVVCDHKMRIRYLDARYAGSVEDWFIWTLSLAKTYLQKNYDAGDRNCWLLGDTGYPLEPYLMTPYRSAVEGSAEAVYNTKHAKARQIVERAIVMLKTRFRCLLGDPQLHYEPSKATIMVNVCAALHNICIEYCGNLVIEETGNAENIEDNKDNEDCEDNEYIEDFEGSDDNETESSHVTEAREMRDQIKACFV